MASLPLCFCSYNCRGWRLGSNFATSVLQSCDLLFIQEHWLLPDHLGALDIFNDFFSVGVSGMDSSELQVGRPYGGCGILFRKHLSPFMQRVKSCSRRFCALSLTIGNSLNRSTHCTLLINVYLPTDYGTSDSNNSFLETLSELEGFISSNPYDNVIIFGDFNVDFSRPGHNSSHLTSFMHDYGLVCADLDSGIQYTYRRDDHSSFSRPDHIITLEHYAHLIKDISCSENVDNFSDHLPLSFTLATLPTIACNFSPGQFSGQISCSKSAESSTPNGPAIDWPKGNYVRNHLPLLASPVLRS